MNLYRARDIMIPLDKYPHIPHWFSIRQALAEMEHAEFDVGGRKSLPRVVLVFDEEYNLLGLVRRRDILRGLEPDNLSNILAESEKRHNDPEPPEISPSHKVLDLVKKRVERPVSKIMMRVENAVDYDDNIIEVASKIVDNNVSLLPVLKDGEVVGVVRTVELLNEVSKVVS